MKNKILAMFFAVVPLLGGCEDAVAGRDNTLSRVLSTTIAKHEKDSKNIHKVIKVSNTEYQITASIEKQLGKIGLDHPYDEYEGEITLLSHNAKTGFKQRFKMDAYSGDIEGGEIFYPTSDKILNQRFNAFGKGIQVGDQTFHYYSNIKHLDQQVLWYDLLKTTEEEILKVSTQK